MSVPRIEVAKEFSISRLLKGGWQLSQGHSTDNTKTALADMDAFVRAGITTFDCADIYTGVEELIGAFVSEYRQQHGTRPPIEMFTKFVPDYDQLETLTKRDVERVIDRSLRRLRVERLDMVQFSWWNYAVPRWIEAAHWLAELQAAGKIHHLGGTNFNTAAINSILQSGVKFSTLQVQYSLLDHRPEKDLLSWCRQHGVQLVCYGTVAGGFLSEHWLDQPEPQPPFQNRSLIKYKLMIDEWGGWKLFQELLHTLQGIASAQGVSITNVATRYILDQPGVAGIIVGARSAQHLEENLRTFDFGITDRDLNTIRQVLQQRQGPSGDVFDLERIKDGPHGRIMRYNLNQQAVD